MTLDDLATAFFSAATAYFLIHIVRKTIVNRIEDKYREQQHIEDNIINQARQILAEEEDKS